MKLAEDLRRAVLQAAIEGKLTGGTKNWRWVWLGDIISLISGTDLPSDQHNTVGNAELIMKETEQYFPIIRYQKKWRNY